MLYRKRKKDIDEWINDGPKALLVEGARQVGKSFLIRECLKESGKPFTEINLILDKPFRLALIKACEQGVESILVLLSLHLPSAKKRGQTDFLHRRSPSLQRTRDDGEGFG